ncbi:MAG: hypothetical protein HY673_10520 [Chloroflexi bacterium]|nr:hypothetical protein [Chloroflexota bacterium]
MPLRTVTCYDCLGNRVHVVARCPKCPTGTLMATGDKGYSGIIQEECSDCGDTIAFYVVMPELKAWLLAEPLQMKRGVEDEDTAAAGARKGRR